MSKQDYSLDRALPSNPEIERAVIACIVMDQRQPNECLLQASNKLKVSDFSLDSHRRIYQAILELGSKEKPIDFNLLTDVLTANGELEAVGGSQYVTNISDGIPRLKNIEHYCDILIAHSTRRQVIHSCNAAMQSAYDDSDTAELTDRLQVAADGIRNRTHAQTCIHVSQIGPKLCQRLIAEYDSSGSTIGLPTGIGRLDFALGGLVKGENIVVAGYTGGGKTAFALNVVEKNCLNDVRVTYYSFEVDRDTLLIRLAAKRRGIPQIKLRTKTASRDELLEILDEINGEISRWPLYIDDRSKVSPAELYASARIEAARGTRLFVTDHIHIFANNCKGHTIREQVNEASGTIRAMAKDSQVPVLNLCQLSRPEDKRSPQKPTMYHLKESGALEQDAHSVVLLWRERDEDLKQNGGFTGNDAMIIGKNRSGPVLEIAARYHEELMYWKESNPYDPPSYYQDGQQPEVTQ